MSDRPSVLVEEGGLVDSDAPAEVPTGSLTGPAVVIDHVTKRFDARDGSVVAVDDVSFDVPPGSFVSIVGPSGCGKSTLMRMVGGLAQPTSGHLEVEGSTPLEVRRQRRFGVVFQRPELFEWRTIEDNVALPLQICGVGRSERRQRARELLDLVGLAEFRRHRPRQLSGGMAQRAAIARALTTDPGFLLMDEPFGSLDMMTRERMQTELLRIWGERQGTTVLFITHSIDEAVLLSDQVIVMSARPGRVLERIAVDLPRPRHDDVRDSAGAGAIAGHIRSLIYSQEDC